MPRPRLPEDQKKVNVTIALPKWMVDQLREIKGYNRIIEELLKDYLSKKR